MISDEQLREAARRAEKNLLAALPEPEDCAASPSPQFQRKMKKLIRRTDHPFRYWVQKAAACILLTILLGGGSLLALSTDARAAFAGWVRELQDSWFVYRYNGGEQDLSQTAVYFPTWLPNGYTGLKHSLSDDVSSFIYINDTGDLMTFAYAENRESINLYSEYDGTVLQTVLVGNTPADLYLDQREGNANSLIWNDEEKGVIFLISAHCTGEELVKVAESITETNAADFGSRSYDLTWVPDGYELEFKSEPGPHMITIYRNAEGNPIIFNYSINIEAAVLQIGQEGAQVSNVYVGDILADLYIDSIEGNANHLVWEDEEQQGIFWITSTLGADTLVKIAENITETNAAYFESRSYDLTWVPDGYELEIKSELGPHMTAIYRNAEGHTIVFSYSSNVESTVLGIEQEGTQVSHVYIGKVLADLYIDNTEGYTNHLVWEDEEQQGLFWIASKLNAETMVKIAENIKRVI